MFVPIPYINSMASASGTLQYDKKKSDMLLNKSKNILTVLAIDKENNIYNDISSK